MRRADSAKQQHGGAMVRADDYSILAFPGKSNPFCKVEIGQNVRTIKMSPISHNAP